MSINQSYDDKELLSRIAAGDEQAFTHVYKRYWEVLYAIAYNRTKDIHLSRDIVQDVFTSLWHNRHKTEVYSLKNYLASAVKYLTLAHLRKSGKIILGDEHLVSKEAGYGTVDQQTDYNDLLRSLQVETDKLPEKCRLIFKYSREQGLSINEIADQLKISPRTVETQISKAIRFLRKSLKIMFSWLFYGLMIQPVIIPELLSVIPEPREAGNPGSLLTKVTTQTGRDSGFVASLRPGMTRHPIKTIQATL